MNFPLFCYCKCLWTEESCGFIGGEPKTGKTWIGFDMAVSIAADSHLVGWADPSLGGKPRAFAALGPRSLSARFLVTLGAGPAHSTPVREGRLLPGGLGRAAREHSRPQRSRTSSLR